MPSIKSRFVTACQQLLALGLVLAALTPAANLVSLEVVQRDPAQGQPWLGSPTRPVTELAAYARTTTRRSVVPVGVVQPVVREVALTAPSGSAAAEGRLAAPQARVVARRGGGSQVTSTPQAVTGYGAVGVTWQHGVRLDDEQVAVEVRTETADAWTGWMPVQYDADHGPDPRSAEARRSRPGTDALLVGDVDAVQVRVRTTGVTAPPDLRLAVVAPGRPTATARQAPAIDTRELADEPVVVPEEPVAEEPAVEEPATEEPATDGDGIVLDAAAFTPKPVIYSRAQWGADERLRDRSSLSYFEVHAGFVHHTVNANDYTQAQVPGLLRSIYAYHTRSRGWSDVGYNYLVDRFGRIWEGRAGGVDRPVVGAHTLGYNESSFAMSAIGNFDVARPPAAMVQAYGALFAWKLSLHGVDASSMSQAVGRSTFRAVNGHRDAGSTACPGRYLYARLATIRDLAARAQRGWAGRELESDLASTPHPDLVVRGATDKMGYLLPTGGLTGFRAARTVSTGLADLDTVVASADLTGDGRGDLVVRSADGTGGVLPGTGTGTFGALVKQSTLLAGHDLVTAVGDLDGDGDGDLVARDTATGRLDAYVGGGSGGFVREPLTTGWGGYDRLAATGDVDGDGEVDLLARETTTGRTWLHPGTTGPGFAPRRALAPVWKQFDTITGAGDLTADRVPDLYVRRADTKVAFILPGRGGGTYGRPVGPITRTRTVSDLSLAQVSGTAAADVVARKGGSVVVLEHTGGVELGQPIPTGINLAQANRVLNAGDWDRDGHGDLLTRNKANGALYLRLGDGTGRFGTSRPLASGFGAVRLLAAVGDMTGDGFPDLMGQPKGGDMRIWPGRGTAGLAPAYVAHSAISATKPVPVGRYDADGAPDVLYRNGASLSLYPGNGPGGLTSGRRLTLDVSSYDWVVGISDIALVGHSDLVVREKATGYLFLVPMTDTGFGKRRYLGEGMKDYDLAG